MNRQAGGRSAPRGRGGPHAARWHSPLPVLRHRPPDSAKEVAAKARVAPDLEAMAERRVEDPAPTAHAPPSQRIITIPTLAFGDVDRRRIQAQEHVNILACPATELIDLIGHLERGPEVLHRGVSRVLDPDPDSLVPRVPIEVRPYNGLHSRRHDHEVQF